VPLLEFTTGDTGHGDQSWQNLAYLDFPPRNRAIAMGKKASPAASSIFLQREGFYACPDDLFTKHRSQQYWITNVNDPVHRYFSRAPTGQRELSSGGFVVHHFQLKVTSQRDCALFEVILE
jgi:hypothetical protein